MNEELVKIARYLMELGIKVIAVPFKDKKPNGNSWPHFTIDMEDLEDYFGDEPTNLGAILGKQSGGLVDVDLDCKETRIAGHYFLPETGMISGRKSSTHSHYFYFCKTNLPEKTRRYRDVATTSNSKERSVIIELRSTGAQTVMPSSVHPSGEKIVFYSDGKPAEVDGEKLHDAVKQVYAVAIVARHWPPEGCRHDCSLALAGFLLRRGFTDKKARKFIRVAAFAAGDEEYMERGNNAESTAERLRNGENFTGGPTLEEFLGKQVVKTISKLIVSSDGEFTCDEGDNDNNKRLPTEYYKLFRDQFEEPHICMKINDHWETHSLNSRHTVAWMANEMDGLSDKAPSGFDINNEIRLLEYQCLYNSPQYELFVRIGPYGDDIWIDLADSARRAIKVNAQGWEIADPPILFHRYKTSSPQAEPVRGGNLEMIRRFLNVKNEDDWILVQAWIIGAFIPTIPHPLLVVYGEQGTAKTTNMVILSSLIDPSRVGVCTAPEKLVDWIQTADHRYVVTLDNVTHLPQWLSDCLCRAVTGEAFSKRKLYTDTDDVLFGFRRVVALTGIQQVAQKPDLLDRAILLGLQPIPPSRRKLEAEVLQEFGEARPAILGAILDTLSGVMAEMPNVKLSSLPRMADFARVGVAVERVLGWDEGTFMNAYNRNVESQHEEAIDASPVAQAIRTFMLDEDKWKGTATQLLNLLIDTVCTDGRLPRDWPKTASRLSGKLHENAPNLRHFGIDIEFSPSNGRKLIVITKQD
ncbi:MAG: bifunctional DNA primase/polymerase [Armatimonadota bacterium]